VWKPIFTITTLYTYVNGDGSLKAPGKALVEKSGG
jgi:hypothetical protein